MSHSLPIACSLTPEAYADRLSWIAKLNRSYLRTHRLTRGALELSYDPQAAPIVRELIRREQLCCAFLDFSLVESNTAVALRIGVPVNSSDQSELLLSPFLEGTSDFPSNTRPASARTDRITRLAAVSSATAAVACGVCCVLPFALPAVALTVVGSVFAAFVHVYWWALTAAIASLLVIGALSWPLMEPHVIRLFKH